MKFLNRVLLVLDRLYQFDGGQSGVNQMDLARPITLVHDVSRSAEIGSGPGKAAGWFAFLATVSHAGAGSLQTAFNIQTAALATNLYDPAVQDIWLFDTALTSATAGIFTSALEATSAEPLQAQNTTRFWRSWTGELTRVSGGPIMIPTYEYPRPVPMLFPSTLVIDSTVGGAGVGDLLFNHICWIGAKGALPPYVA